MPAQKQQRHTAWTVFVLSLIALIVGAVTTVLRADLDAGGSGTGGSSSSSSSLAPAYRECSSRGTMFEDIRNLDEARNLFASTMGRVTEERQKLLTDTSNWSCTAATAMPMPTLTELADSLPAWHYRKSNLFSGLFGFGYTTELRPVTFASFSSIVGEYLRVYECTVAELQSSAFVIVSNNQDYPPGTQFCCTQNGCEEATRAASLCTGAVTDKPDCGGECSQAKLSMLDLAKRPTSFSARAIPERTRARIAVERTLTALHSYEMEHETIRQLSCAERATLDALSMTALLSEAASCLPKIWDVSTSLHDRSPYSPINP
ncbi:MAG: hypothetical protein ABL890_03640 [Candidatus Peribacteraceae bacterium]